MDEVTTPTSQQITQPADPITPQPLHEQNKKYTSFFTILGKLFLFLLLALSLLLGGYYLGSKKNSETLVPPTPTLTTSPTETLPSPTSASQTTKAVKAGLSGTTSFLPYSIDVPGGWTDARETTIAAGIDKLTLTKNGYSVTIYQAPMGGGGCLYKGDPEKEMAQRYTNYVDINGKNGQYRRSWTESAGQAITYTICQKSTIDSSYGNSTAFGAISVVSPNPATTVMLAEVDGMIASLIKQ